MAQTIKTMVTANQAPQTYGEPTRVGPDPGGSKREKNKKNKNFQVELPTRVTLRERNSSAKTVGRYTISALLRLEPLSPYNPFDYELPNEFYIYIILVVNA